MTIEVKLREVIIGEEVFQVPTNLIWNSWSKRWTIQITKGREYLVTTGYPAFRHGSVRLAYRAAIEGLEQLRRLQVVDMNTARDKPNRTKRDQDLMVGIELETKTSPRSPPVHYLRVHVGSLSAETLFKRSFRVGIVNQYTFEHYEMVLEIAKQCRTKLREDHRLLVVARKGESVKRIREELKESSI